MAAPLPERDVPAELALLAIDMEKYSQIPEAGMDAARCDVDDILTTVLAECGLPALDELPGYKDSGDGAFLLFPSSLVARLVDPLLGRLDAALRRYRQHQLADSPLVRLRVSVHAGPLSLPHHRGDAINDAARLLNSQAVREAMAAARDSGGFLAAVLSELVYHRTVQANRTPGLREHHFVEAVARVSDKAGFEQPCRIHVPNLTAPAVRPYLTDAQPPAHTPAAAEPATAPAPPADSRGGTFHFHGQLNDPTIADRIKYLRIDRRQH
ncbi:hypothetical protein ACFV6E_32590 [Streptomyces sp. NPDC059785]|uniref:hypothetical protein n=1 Tax=Streptomyces sp. NPDC059785 TaxID=3346945 RepID=UPI00364AE8DD